MVENQPYFIDNHINSPDIYVGVGDTLYQYRALAHFDFGFRNADFGFINLIIKNIHNNIEFGRRGCLITRLLFFHYYAAHAIFSLSNFSTLQYDRKNSIHTFGDTISTLVNFVDKGIKTTK